MKTTVKLVTKKLVTKKLVFSVAIVFGGFALVNPQRGLSQDDPAEGALEAPVQVEMEEGEEAQDLFMEVGPVDEQMPARLLLQYAQRECGLVRRACQDLSDDQRKQLEAIDGDWIKAKLKDKKAKGGGGNAVLRGIGRFLGGNDAVQMMAPDDGSAQYKRVRTVIDAEINSILSQEQRAIITEEKRLRDEFRTQATSAVLVSALDEQICVSPAQREQLVDVLSEWLGKKQLYWQFYFSNGAYVPDIPRSVLGKSLSEEQMRALDGLNRYNYEMDDYNLEMNGMVQVAEFKDP